MEIQCLFNCALLCFSLCCGGGGDQEAQVGRDHQVSYGLSVDQIRFDGLFLRVLY